MKVILASASKSRANLLRAAGVPYEIFPAAVDEDAVKVTLRREGATAQKCAETLAEFKAVKVSRERPNDLVIGADQMLECDGTWFDKPRDIEGARSHLMQFRGRVHTLPTTVAVALNGAVIWHHSAAPRMTVRDFSDQFLDAYLAEVGDAVTSSVGAYHLEGRGAQLFTKIDGDFFTILGLPLLELLSFLREHQVVTR
jgi:septum formation protein